MPSDRLSDFPHGFRSRLQACTALSDRVGQLAASHPLLFFALAAGYGPLSARREAVRLTELGRPLREVCAAVGIPYALRAAPATVLPCRLTPAALSEKAAGVLVGHAAHCDDVRDQARVIEAAFYGTRICHEAFGIWLAHPTRVGGLPRDLSYVRGLALFAWFSGRLDLLPASLWRRTWTPAMSWIGAIEQAGLWLDHLKFYVYFDSTPIADPWAEAATVDGYDIVPLLSFDELIEEVRDMANCLQSYADRLRYDRCRLFGVRLRGAKVGTVEIRRNASERLKIAQFCGPRNAQIGLEAWHAVQSWIERQSSMNDPGHEKARQMAHALHAIDRFRQLTDVYAHSCSLAADFWETPAHLDRLAEEIGVILQSKSTAPDWPTPPHLRCRPRRQE